MKIILLLILFLQMLSVDAQEKIDSVAVDKTEEYVSTFRIKSGDRRSYRIQIYADSINNYISGPLPNFLSVACFDRYCGLWEGFHSPACIRWEILKRVNNKAALKKILKKHDNNLDLTCKYVPEPNNIYVFQIPMEDKSTFVLIRKRYRELHHKIRS